jgi:cytochrome b
MSETRNPGVAPDVRSVAVWDWPVRVFHWSLAVLLVAQVVTATMGGSAMDWHLRGGYAVLALVLFRLAWGVMGSPYARFGSFVRGPAAVGRYARSLLRRTHEPHVGHTPLGAWMILALLLLLLAQASTGLFANDEIATEGPLAKLVTQNTSDLLSSIHRRMAWVVVALAGVHVAAVLYYLAVLRENLVRPMITGVKVVPARLAPAQAAGRWTARALVVLAACAFAVWWIVNRL